LTKIRVPPVTCSPTRRVRLFAVAGILPAGTHSGFYTEPRQHISVEHVPGNDDRDNDDQALHPLLLLVLAA
jgi:hypothetical protein